MRGLSMVSASSCMFYKIIFHHHLSEFSEGQVFPQPYVSRQLGQNACGWSKTLQCASMLAMVPSKEDSHEFYLFGDPSSFCAAATDCQTSTERCAESECFALGIRRRWWILSFETLGRRWRCRNSTTFETTFSSSWLHSTDACGGCHGFFVEFRGRASPELRGRGQRGGAQPQRPQCGGLRGAGGEYGAELEIEGLREEGTTSNCEKEMSMLWRSYCEKT